MLHKIFNLRNIYGVIAFLALIIGAPGAVEAGMYVTAVIMIAIFGISAYLALREDGCLKINNIRKGGKRK